MVVLEKVPSGKPHRFEAPEEQFVKIVVRQEQSDENHLRKLLMHGKRRVEYPEVSIIIPVHNEGEKLYLTLEALRYSTNVNYEVIVVDDGSTDLCCDFLRSNHSLFNNVLLVNTFAKTGDEVGQLHPV